MIEEHFNTLKAKHIQERSWKRRQSSPNTKGGVFNYYYSIKSKQGLILKTNNYMQQLYFVIYLR